MAEIKYPIASPIGRIVEGDAWTAQEKDMDGQVRVIKNGPNAGKPNPQYYIGLAVPKLVNGAANPDFNSFYAFIDQVARGGWPNLFPNGGACVVQDFAWKIRDGDGFIRKGKNAGKSYAEKPGFAGHWIISFASSFAPEVIVETSPGVYAAITDKELVKRGYYVRVGASVSSNGSTQTPGLYLNLEKIELKGKGEVIQAGLSAAQVFGGQPAGIVPEGMQALTAMDLAGAPAGFGNAPAGQVAQAGFPSPGGPATGFPQPGGPAQVAVGLPPAAFAPPATGAPINPAGFPGVGGPAPLGVGGPSPALVASPISAPPPPPAAQAHSGFMGGAPVMLPAANGATYEQFLSQGWTEQQMIDGGFMAAR